MKKIIATLLLATAVFSSSFATGLTQLELAKLLVDKAKAENLIEQKEYTEEEILSFVMTYDLMDVTDASAEMEVSNVREILADYDSKKLSITSTNSTSLLLPVVVDNEFAALYDEERLLSHEFMKMVEEEYMFNRELGFFSLNGQSFPIRENEKYPLIGKYTYELYRIFGWYAREYNMYVYKTPSSVALYRRSSDVEVQGEPLIIVEFDRNPTDDNNDGIAYSIRMKVNALYNVKYNPDETLAENRERIVATGFKQPHLVMALRDASSLFIKNEKELNAFVNSYVSDVVENEDKEYSYAKRRHETFEENRYYISKIQGSVFYYLDYDLTTWGE